MTLPEKCTRVCPKCFTGSSGFAIISVLLILTVLTIMIVAFLQSMRIDRLTARAYLNMAAAESAARAGVTDAMGRVENAILEKPFHAVGYHAHATTTTNDAPPTVIFGTSTVQAASQPTTAPDYIYLASSVSPETAPNLSSGDVIDLNALDSSSEPHGWIGAAVISSGPNAGTHNRKQHRAEWIEVLADPLLPEQPDPQQADYNPVVARYAYWVEDESSKINFRISGNSNGSSGVFDRSIESNTISDIDAGALPMRIISGQWLPLQFDATSGALNTSLINMFQPGTPANRLLDPRIINRNEDLNPANADDIYEAIKFHATVFSETLNVNNLSRKRININSLVDDRLTGDSDTVWANKIQADLDDILYAITGKHTFSGVLASHNAIFADSPDLSPDEALAPEFGQRFYLNTIPAHQDLYLKRIAANIRDYVDTDSYPTLVDASGSVLTGAVPTAGWLPGSEPQAIGKEAIPYLQEHMWRGKETAWTPAGGNRFDYTVEMDHYFEFVNPTTKDYTAPAGTTVKVYNQPRWLAGSFEDLEPDDVLLDISNVTFPAGRATVVTTDPNPPSLGAGSSNIVTVPVSTDRAWTSMSQGDGRTYQGTTDEPIGSDYGLQLSGRSSSITDYESEMIMGNDSGFMHGFGFLSVSLSFSSQWNFKGQDLNSNSRFFYGASLRGNDKIDRSGDPRSLNEQIELLPYSSGGPSHQSRFYGSVRRTLDNSDHTLGRTFIQYVDPDKSTLPWPDYTYSFDDTPKTAFAVIADKDVQSIGELGHIYDPHRKADSPSFIKYARGGGRTLRIGQKDDVVSATTRFTANWRNAAWQLCDIFDANPNSTTTLAPDTRSGLINLNSVQRDGGTALRATLRQMDFLAEPDSDFNISSQNLSNSEIDLLINSLKTYLDTKGPLLNRGELSEISYFDPEHSSDPKFAGRDTATINDRGREEVFRRLVQLVGTRSTTFSIYVVGDAIQQNASGEKRRLARQRYKVVFRLTPQFSADPNSAITGFDTEILYETF